MDPVLRRGDVEGAAVYCDRDAAFVRGHARSISPMGPVDLRPWPVIARTTVASAARAAEDRAMPACAAAEVGSTKIPCDKASEAMRGSRRRSPRRSRRRFREWRRGSGGSAVGGRCGCLRRWSAPARPPSRPRHRPRRRERAARTPHSGRRRGAARVSIRPASLSLAKPAWTPSNSVPPPSGATTTSGGRRPSCSKTS